MYKSHIKQLNKQINKILSNKTLIIFPIMGGLSTDPSVPHQPTRNVTPEESEILQKKGLPCPIRIALSREKEFKEILYGSQP